ncbi:hypothetical protein ACFQJ7_03230 [Halovenus rubra]|uniref:Uncharacterized protein n=2 Tax=Halovenus rubra TaxID=869890 RepID=A0ABD5X4X1_9EURY|nr:hypothetical protein [Halovenus rubra]
MEPETTTVSIEVDGESDEFEIPLTLTNALSEGEESSADVVGNLALLGLAQQAHGIVHHGHGDVGDELEAAEEATLDEFEERFGQSFQEMTGHSH